MSRIGRICLDSLPTHPTYPTYPTYPTQPTYNRSDPITISKRTSGSGAVNE